jgi:dTDP-4-dehydrorhamnose 3,5-epimerase
VKLVDTPLAGVVVIELAPAVDERGWFERTYSVDDLAAHGIAFDVVQASTSFNEHAATLRGMHLQLAPHEEHKHVRCVRGALFDVVVDLRPDQPTYRSWWGRELRAHDHTALVIPPGVAHGFLTLEPHTELEYLISTRYEPSAASGVRWDDPAFSIEWPRDPVVISERDRSFPDHRA